MKSHIKPKYLIITVFLAYFLISTLLMNQVFASTRNSDLLSLNQYQYRGILPFIQELQIAKPNWSFTLLYTGLDWNSVIDAETISYHGRSLTQNTNSNWLCSTCGSWSYDSGWYCASRQAVEFYMDPRNWLNPKNIFSFEALSYNPSIHNIDGVNAILKGTFMDRSSITYTDTSGNLQTIYKSYAQIIMEAAEESGVSPYHLASRIRQEQGAGNSALISGTFEGYVGYYNYFNIGASGDGELNIIINGLAYASSDNREYKWTTPELSIKGGAKFIASGYISKKQDTLYLEKYNVDTTNINSSASHQYMQNISAHISEGLGVYKAYNEIGVINNNFNFIIPVFENMPVEISPRPTTTSNLVTQDVVSTVFSLNIRESNSTGSSVIANVPMGTNLLRIETAKEITNGYYWDKVIYFKDGQAIMGYVARDYITQVADKVTTEEMYYTSTTAILRNGPGVNSEAKGILDYFTSLTVIDKMAFPIDNMIWYRVRLIDGTQGYVPVNFLSPAITEQEPPSDEVYKIEGEYIITVPGAKIEQIEGATTTSTVFGTGAKINIADAQYTLVMLGDVNGDSLVDARDSARILKFSVNQYELNNFQTKAADVNKDGVADARDSARILKFSVNLYNIFI